MLLTAVFRKMLSGRPGNPTPGQSGLMLVGEPKSAPPALDMSGASLPRRPRPQLIARWHVEELVPDRSGRLIPRLRAQWQICEAETAATAASQAQSAIAPCEVGSRIVSEVKAS
jgi:hypothetical protein